MTSRFIVDSERQLVTVFLWVVQPNSSTFRCN